MATARTVRAEIVTTGTEILLGEIVDTNAAWIARQLREIGVNLHFKITVGDNRERIRWAVETAIARSDVVIVTGGLGPTVDDVTRDAIADATGCPLVFHPEIAERLRARFARWGYREMPPNNLRQAWIPQGATVVPNPVGTAPGFIVAGRRPGLPGTAIALPGVPREMKRMMADTVLPYLRELTGGTGVIRRRILRTVGIGESAVDARIHDLMQASNPTVGLSAHVGQVDVRITARAETGEEAERLLDEMEARIRERIGEFVYTGDPTATIEQVAVDCLRRQGATLALVETVTGGAVAQRLRTQDPEGAILVAGWTAEPQAPPPEGLPAALAEPLARPPGPQAAETLAQVVRELAGADYGLAVVGTGRLDESFHSEQTGESWLALAGPQGVVASTRFPFGGRDPVTTVWVANRALDLVRRALCGTRPVP